MKRLLPLIAVLSAALSACGSGSVTPAPTSQPAPVGTAPTSGPGTPSGIVGLQVSVTAALVDSASGRGSAAVRVSGAAGLSAQALAVSVVSAPAGLSVQPGTPSNSAGSGVAGGLNLPLSVQASGGSGGDLTLKLTLGTQSQLISVPVIVARGVALPQIAGSGYQAAASVSCPGGDVYLSAPVNAVMEQRTQLLRLNAGSAAVQPLDMQLALTEGVTSLACAPGDELWLTVRSDTAQGSVIAHLKGSTSGAATLERFPVGATADTINNLTRTPDGRLWFVQYKRDRLGEFDPRTGAVTSHAVTENAENLTLGGDGNLYFTRFYTDPAIVRYDPASGSSSALPVGVTNRNLPRAVVQTQGAVWYVDAWTQQLLRLDPASGKATPATLPAGAAPGELVAAPDGMLWVADAAAHVLYRLAPGSSEAVTVPLLGAAPDGPRALSVSASGQLWYQSGGQLVGQQ